MKISRVNRSKGFWITPLIAGDTNMPKPRIWIAWIIWLFKIDFNEQNVETK